MSTDAENMSLYLTCEAYVYMPKCHIFEVMAKHTFFNYPEPQILVFLWEILTKFRIKRCYGYFLVI